MNKENAEKPKKLLINRKGLKVIRLTLAAGGTIPEHATDADVVVVTVKGEGTFYINKNPNTIAPGDVIDLAPDVPHSIDAKSDLELIVTHMRLASDQAEVGCGGDTFK